MAFLLWKMTQGTQGTICSPDLVTSALIRGAAWDAEPEIRVHVCNHSCTFLKKVQQNKQRSTFDTDTPNTQSLGPQSILSSLHSQDKPFCCGAELGFQILGERVRVAAGSQLTVGHDAQSHLILRLPGHFVARKLHKSLPC